jgi:catechol 2,3-dioxygenase-like lactoylglutathione lyase family enzyme
MRPHLSVLTIGVDDLERALLFYRDGLGLPASDIQGEDLEFGAVVFIELQSGLALALWPRTSIAHDSGMPLSGASPTDFTIGHNVGSPNEVDAVMSQAERAGATIVKQPKETFWGGYAGYFQDPDGHLWEIVWNPDRLPPDDAA